MNTRKILLVALVLLVLSGLWLSAHRYTFLASDRWLYRCDRWSGKVERALYGRQWEPVSERGPWEDFQAKP